LGWQKRERQDSSAWNIFLSDEGGKERDIKEDSITKIKVENAMRQAMTIFITVLLMISVNSKESIAEKVEIIPEKVTSITSPTDSRDERLLVYFELPENLYIKDIHIDYAKLVFRAEVTGEAFGLIEILPVTTSWKDSETVTWTNTWEKAGGDFTYEQTGDQMTVKSAEGKKDLNCDVTFVVKAWIDDVFDNNGFIIIPTCTEGIDANARYTLEKTGIVLVVNYSY
jgi:hypothetical protein